MQDKSTENTTAQVQVVVALKSTGIAFLFWFLLGGFGGHRFYLGFVKSGLTMLFTAIFAWVFLWGGLIASFAGGSSAAGGLGAVAIVVFIAYAVWLIVDACRLGSLTAKANEKVQKRIKPQ